MAELATFSAIYQDTYHFLGRLTSLTLIVYHDKLNNLAESHLSQNMELFFTTECNFCLY